MSSDRSPLRALLVEDNPDDAAIILRALSRGGFDVEHERVETAAGLRAAISRRDWDVVIADYTLPAFTGPEAFVLARRQGSHLPFILVSGAVGEETVANAMRQGIDDYLMKDNLTRLPSAVDRAIQSCEERKLRQEAERSLRHRDAILLAVGVAANRLLAADDWRMEIEEVVAQLGKAAEVSRAYLYSFRSNDHTLATQEVEWASEGITARAGNPEFKDFDLENQGFDSWARELHEGRHVHGHREDFPAPIQEQLERWDVASLAIIPIMVEERLWGTIGFDVCHAPRDWSAVEIEALKIAADTVGAAIKRIEARAHLQRRMEHLNALRTIDRAIAGSLDIKLTLDVVLDQVTGQLGVDAARILLWNPMTQQLEHSAGRGIPDSASRSVALRMGEGHAGRAALERRPVHVPDLRSFPSPDSSAEHSIPRGFISYYALPLIAKNDVNGVLETFCRTAPEADDEWREFAGTLAGQAAIAIDNARMLTELTRSNTELRLAYETTLEGWSRALDLRDNDTQGHTARVAGLTVLLGQALGMDAEEILHLRRGALLHDIGKMGIPDSILLKPAPLTDEEWEVMRRHPVYAYELLSPIAYLRPALDIPHLHHEHWDGTGYPLGLKGEEIPLAARVFAVVDVWDAWTSHRPYRDRVSDEQAREIIREAAGTHFDPRIVKAFLELDLSGAEPARARSMR
ncbi:MAG TPA: HD domain-containing phosphohydrolase [Gemmatimonadota bacterium]|nr:HD domain-containing phosphohydrolase [Gemmatimonadota bacterium]